MAVPVIVRGMHLRHGMMHADVGADGAGVPVCLGVDGVRPMVATAAIGSMRRHLLHIRCVDAIGRRAPSETVSYLWRCSVQDALGVF